MRILVFNPEHDIALSANLANFTAPHAGRRLRIDLGWLPALWATPDDVVLVDDVEHAQRAWNRLKNRVGRSSVRFIAKNELHAFSDCCVEPWGWDLALRAYLLRHGAVHVPSEAEIDVVRRLSHRRTAAVLLDQLRCVEGTVGESFVVADADAVSDMVARLGRVVLKAPWSSSGRGLRFLSAPPDEAQRRWIANIVEQQGGLMLEPQYDKVCDLGMEFERADAGIRYLGLSLFHTKNGAYTGNVLASEEEKREMISRYVSMDLLDAVREKITTSDCLADYRGPFGIDMMVVRGQEGEPAAKLHPCVEINLRRTMGHVALQLTPSDGQRKVMRIDYNGQNYKLKINKL